MYEELVKRLRDQDNCNVLDDVDEAANAIDALESSLQKQRQPPNTNIAGT